MPRLARLLPLLACAAVAASALVPQAAVAAARQRGVVLSAGHGSVRLVDAHHRVRNVHVGSTRGLRRGAVVTIAGGQAHVGGHVATISFYGRVVRSSAHGAVLKLADGSSFSLGVGHGHRKGKGHAARASAAGVTVTVQGLAPGEAVLITLDADGQGNVAITIRLVHGQSIGDGEQDANGVVTDDGGDGTFAIRTGAGDGLRFSDPQRLLEAADASQCDTVAVTYHTAGHRLVADTLRVTGQSSDGACADSGAAGSELDGVVTAIADDLSSLTVDPGDGSDPTTFPVDDPSVLDGVSVGDTVTVYADEGGTATEVDVVSDDSSGGDQGGGDGGDGGDS
jgi:hypothetical protein